MNFGDWTEALHSDVEQRKRIKSALALDKKVLSIDFEARSAKYKGSGKSPYEITLNSCSCVDFVKRKLPCKHIYRLAVELGDYSKEAIADNRIVIKTTIYREKTGEVLQEEVNYI